MLGNVCPPSATSILIVMCVTGPLESIAASARSRTLPLPPPPRSHGDARTSTKIAAAASVTATIARKGSRRRGRCCVSATASAIASSSGSSRRRARASRSRALAAAAPGLVGEPPPGHGVEPHEDGRIAGTLVRQRLRGRGEDVLRQVLGPFGIAQAAAEVPVDVPVVASKGAFGGSVHTFFLA